jgi:hypothetical protein
MRIEVVGTTVRVRVVEAAPVADADQALASWRARHPELWARLTDEDIEVTHLCRGGPEQRRSYTVRVSAEDAEPLVAEGARLVVGGRPIREEDAMRIEVVGDGHVFDGTPKQILMQMKSLAFGAEHMTLREYIEGNVANIKRGFGIEFKLTGETDEELAASFLQQMQDGGHARHV